MNQTQKKPPLTKDQQRLVEDYLTKNEKEMFKCIHNTVKRQLDDEEMEELISVAHLGLCKAARNYKPNRGTMFKSFAYTNIASMVKNEWIRTHRKKNIPQKLLNSIDETTETGLCLKEVLVGVSDVNVLEFERVRKYISTLSDDAKKLLQYLLKGYSLKEIPSKTNFTPRYCRELHTQLQQYYRTSILRYEQRKDDYNGRKN